MNPHHYISMGLERIMQPNSISDRTVTMDEAMEAIQLSCEYKELTDRQQQIVDDLSPSPVRECGSCTMCCRAPAIEEIAISPTDNIAPKPCGATCVHCSVGGGCDRYSNRPKICRSYQCFWVLGIIPPNYDPESVGVLDFSGARRGVTRNWTRPRPIYRSSR